MFKGIDWSQATVYSAPPLEIPLNKSQETVLIPISYSQLEGFGLMNLVNVYSTETGSFNM